MDVSSPYRGLAAALVLLATAAVSPAKAEIRDLPVPSATIYPDDVISESQIVARRFRVTPTSTNGYVTDMAQIIGKQARRRLIAGKPIPVAALSSPFAVRRGGLVTATYAEDGFSISTTLVALTDGVSGDVIQARNPETGIVIQVAVNSDGSVSVLGAP
jgi:flagellar basal body P-ring formation protein FlgA